MCEGVSADTQQPSSKPRLSPNSRLGPAGSPGAPGLPALGQSCQGLPAGAGRVVASSPQPPSAATQSQGAAGGPGETRGRAPAALAPRPRRRSPVQHFADPLAHASPGGGGQAAAATAAAAALGRQVLDGGHHMVRRGWRRRLQLLLRRLGGDHRGRGGGAAAIRTQPGASCAGSGPGNTQRTWPGGRGPGRRRCLRSGEAPAATAAAAQPATHSSPVPVRAPSLRRRRRLPARLFPSRVPKSWHAPRSGREGGRAPPPSCPSAQETSTERADGGPGFAFSPGAQVVSGRAAAVVLAPPQPVPRSLGKLPSVSHGVKDRE